MQENAAVASLKAQLQNFLLQKHELEFTIKEKTEILVLMDEKIGEIRHAINGAQLAVAAMPIAPPQAPEIVPTVDVPEAE